MRTATLSGSTAPRAPRFPTPFAISSMSAPSPAREPFDPMEKAFHALDRMSAPEAVEEDLDLVRVYGLRPDLLAVTQAWPPAEGSPLVLASKGAPETIAELCRFDGERVASLKRLVSDMAANGLRILRVALAIVGNGEPPASPREAPFEFLGLVGLADLLRQGAAAVQECRSAGIRVVMITGDYPETAAAIAREAGLDANHVMTGKALEATDDDKLKGDVGEANVFARIMPDQKLSLVNVLKARGEVVAMTGDGINDAPSLKAAHIGVAMGDGARTSRAKPRRSCFWTTISAPS